MVAYLLVAALLAADLEVQVTTFDGQGFTGTLKSVTAEQVVLETADGETAIEGDKLHWLAPKAEPVPPAEKPAALVELIDGSRLPATNFLAQENKATLTTLDGVEVTLPINQIRLVRFGRLDDPNAEVGAPGATGDLIGVRKSSGVDYLEGAIGDVTAEAVKFTLEGDAIPVNRAKVDSLVYARKVSDEGPTPACVVEDAAGAVLKAKSAEFKDGKLQVKLLAGPSVVVPVEALRKIDFSAGKLVYLSELKPESVNWTSYFDLGKQSPALANFLGPRFDRGREDSVMRLGGKTYKRGVSLTSRTEMVYKLPAKSRRFQAVAGIDDLVGNLGSVQLVVTGDGRTLYTGKLTGKDEPVELDLDLTGVRRLTVLVDYGGDLDIADHLNLCEARIVK